MKGLLIKSPWIELIFQGKKTWEIRGSNTSIRGKIALIKSGTSHILGTVDVVDSKRLTLDKYEKSEQFHCISGNNKFQAPYKRIHAWVLENPQRFKEPVPYQHPQGAVIWVNLKDMKEEARCYLMKR
ncbi:ASCH domain-containing protein [Priestia filamentosa]|uniref:ASCH domain-containing protein n=1 Tax=Priestia filamentosa TaxID=1402861 RepID=UPI002896269D|nr:ASCH domain-containing protein [Priestia filamentosa]MDT3766147.1 ASCH domain-containing protein [Priestia filamentosa]